MSKRASAGFSLIEALVAVVLVGGGLAGVVSAMGATDKTEARILLSEKLQRLAQQKLDEVAATQEFNEVSGDFSNEGQPEFQWTLTDEPTGVENLDYVTVTVDKADLPDRAETVSTLVYRSLASTGSGGGQ